MFAQVTNPPLDAIREEIVTSVGSTCGPESNLLSATSENCKQLVLPFPIIDNDELAKIIQINDDNSFDHLKSKVISGLYRVAGGAPAMRDALDEIRKNVSDAIDDGARIIVLSDRNSDDVFAPIPSLLLTSAVHHHLIREKQRTKVGLIVESGDAREVHHMALLIGYGAGAINPYLAFESIEDMVIANDRAGMFGLGNVDAKTAIKNYIKASKAVLFEGDGYSEEWQEEAARRGLPNLKTTPLALDSLVTDKAKHLFLKHKVLSHVELEARHEIELEKYIKYVQIEGRVIGDLAGNHILPASIRYQNVLLENIKGLKEVGIPADGYKAQMNILVEISAHINKVQVLSEEMTEARKAANAISSSREKAIAYCEKVKPYFDEIRYSVDKLELLVDDSEWELPKYRELLFMR
jgi:hypothetical protein